MGAAVQPPAAIGGYEGSQHLQLQKLGDAGSRCNPQLLWRGGHAEVFVAVEGEHLRCSSGRWLGVGL